MPQLFAVAGPDAGRRFDVAGPTAVVGRHSTNAVSLADPRASRRHCELRAAAGGGWWVHDLGSGNGTAVNGVAVASAELRHGDRVRVGDSTLEFVSDAAPAERPRVVVRPQPELASSIQKSLTADETRHYFTAPAEGSSPWLRSRLANLAVLYEASELVSSVLDVEALLGRILDLLIRTTDADQACALLADAETRRLTPGAVRSRGPVGELIVSRTVAEHVLATGHAVLIADAADDERFREGASVVRHRLRQIVCAPMKGRRETVGVLFLFTQSSPDAARFTDDHLKLAVAVGHQAAVALEETRYYSSLIQAERLAAVGQTMAGMSHHIKNIMQGVRFGSDMLRIGLAEDDREMTRKGWTLVEKNQARIDDLILDMLNFSKEREPLKEPVDLPSVVADVLDTVRGRAADAGVTLAFDPVPTPAVACDADGLHRALLNVVSNAIDAVAETPAPVVSVAVAVEDDAAEIAVTDNGPGVPADRREDVFKPFVSSKGSRGTGLGLPASRKTLREHGGDLTVEDAPGGGARFVFRLPRAA